MLSKNSIDLLFILDRNESLTIESIGNQLQLSKSSILNIVDELDEYLRSLSNSHVYLERKSGKGIQLMDPKHEMNKVFLDLSKGQSLQSLTLYNGRCIDEILVLINQRGFMTLQELADKIYVSKGTIINDLDTISKILEAYDLKLKRTRKKGIQIDGTEINFRNLFSDIINGKVSEAPTRFLPYDNLNSLYSLFNSEIVNRVNRLILRIIKEDVELSNIQVSALLVHVMIAIRRIKNGETLKMPQKNLKEIMPTKYYEISKRFTDEVEKVVGISFLEDEIGYIAIHLMCTRQVIQNYDLSLDSHQVIDEKLKNVVSESVQIISDLTHTNAFNDEELINGLLLHLKPSIERLKNHLSTKNPYLKLIKEKYVESFEIAIKINDLLNKEYGVYYDEDEIAYLALHVQAYIERANTCTDEQHIAVVCATGIGSSQLLMTRLKNYFEKNIKFEALNINEIMSLKNFNQYDLILSTIPIELNTKVIYIDPFCSENQLKKISDLVHASKNKVSSRYKKVSVFDTDHIHFSSYKQKKEEVIQFMCNRLYADGYVNDEYYESVMKREQIASTAYHDFAIPHGDVKNVKKSCIYIYVCKDGIKWDEKEVHVAFLIALNEELKSEFGAIFNNLYEIVSDASALKRVINAKNELEVCRIIQGDL